MSVEARWNIIKKHSELCPACFGSHQLSNCRSNRSCHCGSKEHNTLLCREIAESSTTSVQSNGSIDVPHDDGKQIVGNVSMIKRLPVYVRIVPLQATSATGESVTLYALLDSGSDVTLVSCDAVHRLKLKGKKFTLRLHGVNDSRDMDAEEVSFSIKGFHPSCVQHELRNVTCVSYLPDHTRSIPSSTITERHHHLQDIEFPSVTCNNIDVIIGADWKP